METWAPIPGYEGSYEVSDHGRVRALDRVTDRGRKWRGRMMTPYAMRNGYMSVTLWKDGKQKSHLVHRLILSAFVGEPPAGTEALHKNGLRSDNALANLAWGTHSENQFDQVEHGTHAHASKDTCPAGHPYDDENTYIYPGRPHRGCRKCRREHMRRWASENPEKAREHSRKSQAKYKAKKKDAA